MTNNALHFAKSELPIYTQPNLQQAFKDVKLHSQVFFFFS